MAKLPVLSICSVMYTVIPVIVMQHLLSVRHCSKGWECSRQADKTLALKDFMF